MLFVVMSVRDRSAEVFGRPMFVSAVGQGIRNFSDEINRADPQNVLYGHPEDFDLYELGTFNDNTGVFACNAPRQVAIGKDLAHAPVK